MPNFNDSYIEELKTLRTSYKKLSWFGKLFFPGKLAAQLEKMDDANPSTEDAFKIYQVDKNHTWFFHRWIFPSLSNFFKTKLHGVFRCLSEAGLLTGDDAQAYFDTVAGHQAPWGFARALKTLSKSGLLTGDDAQANFDAVAGHQDPWSVAQALKILSESGLLTGDDAQANRDVVANHQFSWIVAQALEALSAAGLLTGDDAQANFDAVAGHQGPWSVAQALKILSESGLLTGDGAQANFDAVAGHQDPEGVARTLEILKKLGLLTGDDAQANFDAVAGHQDPEGVARTLEILRKLALLTGGAAQANFDAVAGHQDPEGVARALEILISRSGLLTGGAAQANVDAVVGCQNLRGLIKALEFFRVAEILDQDVRLSQERFNKLMEYQGILLHDQTLWDRIPHHVFTEAHWNRIIQNCRLDRVNLEVGRTRFSQYVNREMVRIGHHVIGHHVIGHHVIGHQQPVFNSAQSTHTASVHQTVSESARRLKEYYKGALDNLDESLHVIVAWVNAQEADTEQRAIQQLVNSSYTFKDPTSNVTTLELLVIYWTAIHDDTMRSGSLQDAQARFLEGLYEIQRAYNLSDTFEDRGGADKQACASGTFNKLIEKLVGIHPYAEIRYITNQGAMRKLLPLIREAAKQYLKEHPEDITVEAVKAAIAPSVREQLFFEFGHKFQALTQDYATFELYQRSKNYDVFYQALTQRQDEHLEQMIEGKLRIADEALDQELSDLIVHHAEAKAASDEIEERPETQEELRATTTKCPNFFSPKPPEGNTSAYKSAFNQPRGV